MTPRSGTVQVPRGLLAGLVAALALAILVAVFLLGRQSVRVESRGEATPGNAPAAAALPAPREATDPSSSTRSETLPGVVTTPSTLPSSTAVAATTPPGGLEREGVARYFQEADDIQVRAKYWSDPQALAKTLLEQAADGNSGGFDELIRAQKNARDELQRLAVPPACAEHHRRSLAVMGEGVSLLERVQAAVSSGDLAGLDGVAGMGRDLEREARAIDELGRSIKERYGS